MAFAAAPAGLALAAAAGWARHMKARRSAEEATESKTKENGASPSSPSADLSSSRNFLQASPGRAVALWSSNGDLLTVVAPPPPAPGSRGHRQRRGKRNKDEELRLALVPDLAASAAASASAAAAPASPLRPAPPRAATTARVSASAFSFSFSSSSSNTAAAAASSSSSSSPSSASFFAAESDQPSPQLPFFPAAALWAVEAIEEEDDCGRGRDGRCPSSRSAPRIALRSLVGGRLLRLERAAAATAGAAVAGSRGDGKTTPPLARRRENSNALLLSRLSLGSRSPAGKEASESWSVDARSGDLVVAVEVEVEEGESSSAAAAAAAKGGGGARGGEKSVRPLTAEKRLLHLTLSPREARPVALDDVRFLEKWHARASRSARACFPRLSSRCCRRRR